MADQRKITIEDCLKGVEIEYARKCIKTNVWIHDDSPTEDLSLGKIAMHELGFVLNDPKGRNIWTMADKEQEDAQLMEEMSEFYRRKSPKSGLKPKIEDHIAQVSINIPDKAATSFCCRVTLEKNVTIYGNQGITVGVSPC